MPATTRSAAIPTTSMVIVASAETARGAYESIRALGADAPPIAGFVIEASRQEIDALGLPVPVLGSPDALPLLVDRMRFGRALICLSEAQRDVGVRARSVLEQRGVRVHEWSSVRDALSRGTADAIDGQLDDAADALLGRPLREPEVEGLRRFVTGRRVLITGAGGSIGAELARRCARHDAASIILMDRSENALFEIDRQLRERAERVRHESILHDVVESRSTQRVMRKLRPDLVLHAAAHKHVPMMQDHPAAALSNNLFGTRSIAIASLETDVERFVMISTDKAVHPTSVMGASKWLAEQLVRSLEGRGATSFRVVRFGNVLGSACSVLQIWSAQLRGGGPITVTDPAMTRYFMTIPEAAALVIQAAALDRVGDSAPVYVLDMGRPIRIGDLAERFVRSRGLTPRWPDQRSGRGTRSVEIRVTGVRPGEKLHEELAHDPDSLIETEAPGILIWTGTGPDATWVREMTESLEVTQSLDQPQQVIDGIAQYVPELREQKPNIRQVFEAA